MTDAHLNWQTLTPAHMPPMDTPFLIWRGLDDSSGGFPCVARRVFGPDGPFIRIHGADDNWIIIRESDYPTHRWAAIPLPPGVERKQRRNAETIRRNLAARARREQRRAAV